MKFIAYMKCSTCVKALRFLNDNNLNPEIVDIKTQIPTKEDIKKYHELSGLDIKRFFNTSGLVYKDLKIKDKLNEMTLEEKYELLSTNGMLIKRPLLICNDIVLVGFKEEEYKKIV